MVTIFIYDGVMLQPSHIEVYLCHPLSCLDRRPSLFKVHRTQVSRLKHPSLYDNSPVRIDSLKITYTNEQ